LAFKGPIVNVDASGLAMVVRAKKMGRVKITFFMVVPPVFWVLAWDSRVGLLYHLAKFSYQKSHVYGDYTRKPKLFQPLKKA